MKYSVEFEIAGLPKNNANGSHGHWSQVQKEAKKWHTLVDYYVGLKKPETPLKKAKLTLIRRVSKCPDPDGLVISFKYVVDGLVRCGVLEDDNMGVIGMPDYRWEKAKPKHGSIFVKVEEI